MPIPLRRYRFGVSPYLIIGANLVPLVGVFAFDWTVEFLMVAYWIETGLYAATVLLKSLTARGTDDPEEFPDTDDFFFEWSNWQVTLFYAVFFVPFYITAGGIIQGAGFFISGLTTPLVLSIMGFATAQAGRFYAEHIQTGQYKRHGPLKFGAGLFTRVFALQYLFLGGIFVALVVGSPLVLIFLLATVKTGVDVQEHQKQRQASEQGQQDETASIG